MMVVNIAPIVAEVVTLMAQAMAIPDSWQFQYGALTLSVLDIIIMFTAISATWMFLWSIVDGDDTGDGYYIDGPFGGSYRYR